MLTMIVVMMIAFTTNLGKLVTERIAIQNTVDLAAYSGAATQAGVLNKIRKDNNDIWKIHSDVRQMLEPSQSSPAGPWFLAQQQCPPCAYGADKCPGSFKVPTMEGILDGREAQVGILKGNIAGKMGTMGTKAAGAARQSAQSNYPGLQLTFPGGGDTLQPPIKTDKSIEWSYHAWALTIPSQACPVPGPSGYILVTERKVDSWYFRDTSKRGQVLFAVEGKGTPEFNFLGTGDSYLGNYFGSRNQLKAYAAALPVAGKMGTIKGGSYSRAHEDMWNGSGTNAINDVTPTQVDKAQALAESQVLNKNYKDYRARYVGIFESNAKFAGGSGLTGAVPNGSKMAH